MTEGIIQETVKPSYEFMKHINDNFNENYADMIIGYYQQDLDSIKQELIADIKKKFPEYKDGRNHTAFWNKIVHHVITEIIGDNQECQ